MGLGMHPAAQHPRRSQNAPTAGTSRTNEPFQYTTGSANCPKWHDSVMSQPPRPDVLVLGVDWSPRALIRAQLIDEGVEVAASDRWSVLRTYFAGPGPRPRLAIIDLKDLPEPGRILDELRAHLAPDHVLVLTVAGTAETAALERAGFHVIARPATLGHIVSAAVATLLRNSRA